MRPPADSRCQARPIMNGSSDAAWSQAIATAAAGIRNVGYLNFYYALGTGDSRVGPSGVFNVDTFEPNGPYYTVIKGTMI